MTSHTAPPRRPLHRSFHRLLLAHALAAPAFAALLAAAPGALAQGVHSSSHSYSIAAGPLEQVLNRFGRHAGITLSFAPELTAGLRSDGLQGVHSVDAGLRQLLAGSGVEAVQQSNGSYLLRRLPAAAAAPAATMREITVRSSADEAPRFAGGQVARKARLGMAGEMDVMDTPFNVTSYTAQLIENQQARGLMDVLENDPSVRSSAPIDSESDIVMVRGFEMFGREVMINGMGGLADNRATVLESVDRVEVLKGPSALLNSVSPWGSSTGGSVNYVLKRAEDEAVARFTGSFAADSQLGGHLDLGQRFGDNKQFGVRLNTSYRDGSGAIDHTSNQIGSAAMALDYRGEKLRLTVDLGHQEKVLMGGVGASRIGGSVAIPRAPKASTNFKQPWESYDSDNTYGMLTADYAINPRWNVTATHGGSVSNEAYLLTIHSIRNLDGTLSGTTYWIPARATNSSSEATLRGSFDTGPLQHRLVVAGAVSYARRGQNTLSVGSDVPSNLYAPVAHPFRDGAGLSTEVDMLNQYKRSSLAVTDTISLFDQRLFVMLGARQQKVDNRVYSVTSSGALKQSNRYARDKLTPAAGVVVKLAQNLSWYGNYIESLYPGAQPSTYYANAGAIFEPFPSKQYETGVKYERDGLGLTASAYQINLPNGIEVEAATPGGRPTFAMDGEQRNRGLEVNVFGELARGLRLLGGVSLIDARLTHTEKGLSDGRRARGVPRQNVNLGAEWDVPALAGLTMTARAVYTGEQFIDTSNTRARGIPSWTRYDLGARYGFSFNGKAMTLRANIDNLANRDYWSSASRGVLVVGAPRSVRLSFSMDL